MQDIQIGYKKELFISSIAITSICLLICYMIMKKRVENRYLVMENDMNQRFINAQNNYYIMMMKRETETKMFRHDIKQHIICIQMLYAQKKYYELGEYLKQMEAYAKELYPKISTGNMYIDIILTDLCEKFSNVELEWLGKMPELALSSMDMELKILRSA